MDRLEYEVAEISYAAEAAAYNPDDEARIAAALWSATIPATPTCSAASQS
jgi:hypothetical protein